MGTELNVNWSNRNVRQLVPISAFGLEVQVSGLNTNVLARGTNLVCGPESYPHFLVLKDVPKTKATIGYEFQNRTSCIHYKIQRFFGYL
jgi:hypothetical protein